jgi:hypothetical protein
MLAVSIVAAHAVLSGGQASAPLPAGPLSFGAFTARFLPDGTFALDGEGWPPFKGTWKAEANSRAGRCGERPRMRRTRAVPSFESTAPRQLRPRRRRRAAS